MAKQKLYICPGAAFKTGDSHAAAGTINSGCDACRHRRPHPKFNNCLDVFNKVKYTSRKEVCQIPCLEVEDVIEPTEA